MSPAAPSSATSPTMVGERSLESIRAEFPILSREVNGSPLSYLDNGATVQSPAAVIENLLGGGLKLQVLSQILQTSPYSISRFWGVWPCIDVATLMAWRE